MCSTSHPSNFPSRENFLSRFSVCKSNKASSRRCAQREIPGMQRPRPTWSCSECIHYNPQITDNASGPKWRVVAWVFDFRLRIEFGSYPTVGKGDHPSSPRECNDDIRKLRYHVNKKCFVVTRLLIGGRVFIC